MDIRCSSRSLLVLLVCFAALTASLDGQTDPAGTITGAAALRAAIEDLATTFGPRYSTAPDFLAQLDDLERRARSTPPDQIDAILADFAVLQREALVANPLVSANPILYINRAQYRPDHHATATMFQNDECNTGSFAGPAAIKSVQLATGETRTILTAAHGIARDPELDFDGRTIVFSMRKDIQDDYHIYTINVDGTDLRQLTGGKEISDIDPMFLPNGDIIFSSSREPKYCHCNRHIMCNLFRMGPEGQNPIQIGHNILFEGHPFLMSDGRILYDRWEYVDRHFGPSFGLWTVNPDGTSHTLYYGNNAWSPGAIMDARVIPDTEKVVAIFGSCHDRPWGAVAIVDRRLGLDGSEPVERIWPADARRFLENQRNAEWEPTAIDLFNRVPLKFEDPFPLSDKYFLCSRMTGQGEQMGIVLLDTFGNELLLHTDGPGCFDPMPIVPRSRPPAIPSRIDLTQQEGYFYVIDVYNGTGMEQVPRGSIKFLRVIEAPQKLFWSSASGGIDAAQAPVMNWNCTVSKRILGDVPVEEDGSAYFAVPADKFVFFQALDQDKMMVQSMRSGTTIMPGETQGCIGCHDNRNSSVPNVASALALRRAPRRLEPWYGPTRDFNYFTEVQPVFDKHCVSCHDFGQPDGKVLNLAGDIGLLFNTSYIELRSKSAVRWFPDLPGAKKLLVKTVDDGPPQVLPPFAWGSHCSRLIDVIRSGHENVQLDKESFDRIVTWIDLNAPYYGSYATDYPNNAFGRSPLDDRQIGRLREITGIPIGENASELQASQISFTRPELSPALAALSDPEDPAYKEALAIIRTGQQTLAQVSRPDLPNCPLPRTDRKRFEKYEVLRAAEVQARQSIVTGESHR